MGEDFGEALDAMGAPAADAAGVDAARLADQCEALVEAWTATARGLAELPEADSRAARDARQFREMRPGAPAGVEYGVGQQAGLYVDAIGQHTLAVAALLRARRAPVTVWPLLRVELEIAGRVAWLLDPGLEDRAGEVRVARLYLETISSLQRDRFTAGKLDRGNERRSKRVRDAKIAEARSVFGEVEIDVSAPDKIDSWVIHGELLLGLGAGADLFTDQYLIGNVRALYDFLSDHSHPSLMGIARRPVPADIDGAAGRPWDVDVDVAEDQARLACMVFAKSCGIVAAYFDLDRAPLERWAAAAPSAWFAPAR